MSLSLGQKIKNWGEEYLFLTRTPAQKVLSDLLAPLGMLYCAVMAWRRAKAKPRRYMIPIISIGNLTIGGNGKTPMTIALAKNYPQSAIILRGYGRKSQGFMIVRTPEKILVDVGQSGDEAMLLSQRLTNHWVIVCENRHEAILQAELLGAQAIFLDDGFSKVMIEKFDLLLISQEVMPNQRCLPAGPYRESPKAIDYADYVAYEGIDFHRRVKLSDPTLDMVLVTTIAKPWRLKPYTPERVIASYAFPDHSMIDENVLKTLLLSHKATSLLVTHKDYVKFQHYDLPFSLLELDLVLDERLVRVIDHYIQEF